uniref:COMM domain containing 4 n=1 Tax=Macaca fascicularis TaxID=9541 RepID=A0A2K5V5D8_MACFA
MRGRQVAPEGGGGGLVCTGLSANCAGVRAVGLSSVKLRLLCSQVLKELLGQGIDYEKILKLTADTKFESGDVKATVAVLSFILSSAAKHSVDGESLSSELQQLGLPKEHAASLCRCYEEKQSPLQKHLRVCSLRKLKQAQTLMSSLG